MRLMGRGVKGRARIQKWNKGQKRLTSLQSHEVKLSIKEPRHHFINPGQKREPRGHPRLRTTSTTGICLHRGVWKKEKS